MIHYRKQRWEIAGDSLKKQDIHKIFWQTWHSTVLVAKVCHWTERSQPSQLWIHNKYRSAFDDCMSYHLPVLSITTQQGSPRKFHKGIPIALGMAGAFNNSSLLPWPEDFHSATGTGEWDMENGCCEQINQCVKPHQSSTSLHLYWPQELTVATII